MRHTELHYIEAPAVVTGGTIVRPAARERDDQNGDTRRG